MQPLATQVSCQLVLQPAPQVTPQRQLTLPLTHHMLMSTLPKPELHPTLLKPYE
jgi:hypothetical protein